METVGIPVNALFMHTIILGATGSGKTTTASKIVSEINKLENYINVVIIDWHGEYKHLVKDIKYINPYKDISLNPINEINKSSLIEILDIFEDVFNLTSPQSYLLYESLKKMLNNKNHSLFDLEEIIKNYDESSYWIREVKYALLRKITMLNRVDSAKLFNNNGVSLKDLLLEFIKPIVIDVSLIPSIALRKIYSLLLLKSIFNIHVASRRMKTIVVIEEAHNIFPRNSSNEFLVKYIAESRKFGIGVIAVTQSPSSILEDLMKNTATKIIHSIRSSIDIDIICRITKIPLEYEKLLPVLEPGEAIFYTIGYKYPLIIKILR